MPAVARSSAACWLVAIRRRDVANKERRPGGNVTLTSPLYIFYGESRRKYAGGAQVTLPPAPKEEALLDRHRPHDRRRRERGSLFCLRKEAKVFEK